PSLSDGYWNREDDNAPIFRAMTAGDARPEGPFLRTGDLGAVWNGELFITGRRKDIRIICGRNIHAEDVEQSIEAAHPALQAGCGGVFGVDTEEGEEGIVALYEIERVAVRGLDQRPQVAESAALISARPHHASLDGPVHPRDAAAHSTDVHPPASRATY